MIGLGLDGNGRRMKMDEEDGDKWRRMEMDEEDGDEWFRFKVRG